jgi:hypothetical protein
LRYEKVARGLSKDTIVTDSFRSSTRNSMMDIESGDGSSQEEGSEEEDEFKENSDIDKTNHRMSETMQGRASRSSTGRSSRSRYIPL